MSLASSAIDDYTTRLPWFDWIVEGKGLKYDLKCEGVFHIVGVRSVFETLEAQGQVGWIMWLDLIPLVRYVIV